MYAADDPKSFLRASLRRQRRAIGAEDAADAALRASQVLTAAIANAEIQLAPPQVVAGYYPLSEEISPLPAMQALAATGFQLALPVTAPRGEPLVFRLWQPGDALEKSAFGVMEPAGGTAVVPDALIVPLLGFDAACQRIGYGAGHYDCTIAALRAAGRNPACIGIAFAAQYSDTPIPAGPHDIALDCVVTEERLYWPQTADDGDDDGKD